MTDAVSEQPQDKPSLGDLAEIFYAPRAVFARRRDGSFGMPYAALVILGVAIYFATRSLIQPVIDAQITRTMAEAAAKNNMTADALASATVFAHTMASVGIVAFFLIAPFLIGLFIWVAGRLAGIKEVGKTAIMVAVFSLFPRIAGSIVGAILAAVLPESAMTSAASLSLSPARFVDPSHTALLGLLGRFDLFILWGVVLIAIGMESAAKATRGQAWATAIGVWALAGVPVIISMVFALVRG